MEGFGGAAGLGEGEDLVRVGELRVAGAAASGGRRKEREKEENVRCEERRGGFDF